MRKSMVGGAASRNSTDLMARKSKNKYRKLQQRTVKREARKEREKEGFYHKPCDEERDNV